MLTPNKGCCVGLTLTALTGHYEPLIERARAAARYIRQNAKLRSVGSSPQMELIETAPGREYQIRMCAGSVVKAESILRPELLRKRKILPVNSMPIMLEKLFNLNVRALWMCPCAEK